MTKTLVVFLLMTAGCYGKATADTCHRKYVVDGRGNATRDNYDACMVRASALERGIAPDVEALRQRVVFETGCESTTVRVFEHQGNAATLVGADACGQRLTYARRLRHRLGTRTARGTEWELISATQVAPSVQAAPTTHVPAPTDRVFGKPVGTL